MVLLCSLALAADPPLLGSGIQESGPGGGAALEPAEAWLRYHQGDLDGAAATFAVLRHHADTVTDGRIGELLLAWATGNPTAPLLDTIHASDDPRLVSFAASVASSTNSHPELIRAACDADSTHLACIDAELLAQGRQPRLASGSADVPIALTHGGRIPVVQVAIEGHAPMLFVVDTGSDVNVLSADAVGRLGVDVDYRATGAANVLGEKKGFPWVVAHAMQLGDLTVSDVPFAVLPGGGDPAFGIAGIINPSTFAGDRAVTLDLRDFHLRIGAACADPDAVELPFLRSGRRPAILAEVDARPVRPLILDTGSSDSAVGRALGDLGKRPWTLEAPIGTDANGAGQHVRAPIVTDRLQVRVGRLKLAFETPEVDYGTPPSGASSSLGGFGRVGTDVLLGRVLTLDPANRALLLSRDADFPDSGSESRSRTITYDGALLRSPFSVEERVVAHRAGSLMLDITQDAREHREFEATVPYSPANLHRWGRPFSGGSCSEASDLYAAFDEPGCDELYEPIGDLSLRDVALVSGEVYADPRSEGLCVDEVANATFRGTAVTVSETRCYADPWVVRAAEIADAATGARLLGLTSASP